MQTYDVVVLGVGSGGEWIPTQLAPRGKSVAVIEASRVGGECPFLACIPSKVMLYAAQVRKTAATAHNTGAVGSPLTLDDGREAYRAAVRRRDRVTNNRDDSEHARMVEETGARLIRGRGRVVRRGVVEVNGEEIGYRDLVVGTGTVFFKPPIEGLDSVDAWTSEDVYSSQELPGSAIVLGGGPIGCEVSQVLNRFGTSVTLVELAPRLMPAEEHTIAELYGEILAEDGIDVRTGSKVIKAEKTGDGVRIEIEGGTSITSERVIVAAGKVPALDILGIKEALGIGTTERGFLDVDANCRVKGTSNVWAVGDITGIAMFTHTANYQGRIVSANLLGHDMKSNYSAIPRAVYTDPPLASVGLSSQAATDSGIEVDTQEMEIGKTARATTTGTRAGKLVLVADKRRGLLIGASAVGANADEWIGEAALAIRAQIPLEILADTVHAFPTISEAYEPPYRKLAGLVL